MSEMAADLSGRMREAGERDLRGQSRCDHRGGTGDRRSHALEFARQGARVVVNDLGTAPDGGGTSSGPAHDVVEEIRVLGGEAVANGDDASDWEGARRLVGHAVDDLRWNRHPREQRRDSSGPHAGEHDRERLECGGAASIWGEPSRRPTGRPCTGGSGPNPVSGTTPEWSIPARPPASTEMPDRSTTGRPRQGSPPSP